MISGVAQNVPSMLSSVECIPRPNDLSSPSTSLKDEYKIFNQLRSIYKHTSNSLFKMAELDAGAEKRSRDLRSELGPIDPVLERFLWHLQDDCKKDVIDELTYEYDLDELLEARDIMFATLTNNGDPRIENGGPGDDSVSQNILGPRLSRTIALPWTLIKRRSTTLAADDLCELYIYHYDNDKGFPTKMLKRQALKADVTANESIGKRRSPNPAVDDICELFVYHLDKDKDFPTKMPKKQDPIIVAPESETSKKPLEAIPEQDEEVAVPPNPPSPEKVNSDPLAAFPVIPHCQITPNNRDSVNNETHPVEKCLLEGGSIWSLDDISDSTTYPPDSVNSSEGSSAIDMTNSNVSSYNELAKTPPKTQINSSMGLGHLFLEGGSNQFLVNRRSILHTPDVEIAPKGIEVSSPASNPKGPKAPDTSHVPVMATGPCPEDPNASASMQIPVDMQSDIPHTLRMQNRDTIQCPEQQKAEKQIPTNQPEELTLIQSNASPDSAPIALTRTWPTLDHSQSGSHPVRTTPVEPVQCATKQTITEHRATTGLDKATITSVDMATQTGPKEIADPPIKQSEFTSQMEYVEGTLTNHERRMRTTEVWREKQSRKVDKIDADFFTLYTDLHAAHETLRTSHDNLRESHDNLTEGFLGLRKVVEDLILVTPNYENLISQTTSTLARAGLADAVRRNLDTDGMEDRAQAGRLLLSTKASTVGIPARNECVQTVPVTIEPVAAVPIVCQPKVVHAPPKSTTRLDTVPVSKSQMMNAMVRIEPHKLQTALPYPR